MVVPVVVLAAPAAICRELTNCPLLCFTLRPSFFYFSFHYILFNSYYLFIFVFLFLIYVIYISARTRDDSINLRARLLPANIQFTR